MTAFATRIALACFVLAAANASAAATVVFVNPGNMTDVPRNDSEREAMEADLLEHINELSARLPKGQQLNVEVLDIDLAGDVFPRVPMRGIRVKQGSGDRPAIHLRYTIEQDGRIVSRGERRLVNSNYLGMINLYGSELYSHEKQLLDDWFRKDLLTQR